MYIISSNEVKHWYTIDILILYGTVYFDSGYLPTTLTYLNVLTPVRGSNVPSLNLRRDSVQLLHHLLPIYICTIDKQGYLLPLFLLLVAQCSIRIVLEIIGEGVNCL